MNEENRVAVSGIAVVHVQEKDGGYLHKYETQRIDGFFVYDSLMLLIFENINEKLNAGVELLRLSVDGKILKGRWVIDSESYPDYWEEHNGNSTYHRLHSDFESNLETAKRFLNEIDIPADQFY